VRTDRSQEIEVRQNQTSREYVVEGMTCEHCVLSVTEEVSVVAGVDGVDVDPASGRLVVRGEASDEAVRAAVAEAGYSVRGKT
jgi:copper chaperone